MSDDEPDVHPSSVVDAAARLGAGVVIGPFCRVGPGVVLGARARLDSHVAILGETRVGEDCHLHAGAVVGDRPQDLAYDGAESSVEIGARCEIREGVTIHRGTKAGSATRVGDDCLLMANSHLAHNVRLGDGVIVANGALLAGYVEIGDGAFVSGNCLIHQFVRVGRLAMLSGGTAAKRDVPPFMMTRELSSAVMGLNVVGLSRAGVAAEERCALKRAFKLLYRSGLNISQALERIEREIDSELVGELCEFVRRSERGVAGYAGRRRTEILGAEPSA